MNPNRVRRLLRVFRPGVLFLIFSSVGLPATRAQGLDWDGSLRAYQFFGLERSPFSPPERRRDAELLLVRLRADSALSSRVALQSQTVFQFVSPNLAEAAGLATASTRTFLPLDHDFTESRRVDLDLAVDRLNLEIDLDQVRLVVGRQAISWGVAYIWPVLDLFAPFAPERIDREYKPGVDAVRATIPLGTFSEMELIAGILGRSLRKDGAAGLLTRVHVGWADVGVMGGRFHRDSVAGAFLASDVRGTALRGELSWTRSGDPEDRAGNRLSFWRATLGMDRQLSGTVSLSGEAAWNGYGVSNSADYPEVASSDRIARGEITGLGQLYAGVSAAWRFHPLGSLSGTLLLNWQDPSVLWVPALVWSTGNNSEVLLGSQIGFGRKVGEAGGPGSEYGGVEATVFGAFRQHF